MRQSDLCSDVIHLVNTNPMTLVNAVEPVVDKYREICQTLDEQGAAIYNAEVVKPFRDALPERFHAMTHELINVIRVDRADAPEMSRALAKVVSFSSNGKGQTAQSKQDAAQSAAQIEALVRQKIYFGPELMTTFSTKNGDRIQSAVNYWGRTPEKEGLIDELNKLLPPGRSYSAVAGSNGPRRDPNAFNVDYLLLVALFLHNLKRRIVAPEGEAMETYLPRYVNAIRATMASLIAKQAISASIYTGLGAASIPKGADPRSVGPQALTDRRLTNAMLPIFMPLSADGYEVSPESFSRLAYDNSTFLAICKVVNMISSTGVDYKSKMIQCSRWLRSHILNKQAYRCPNFMKFDPFKVRIEESDDGLEAVTGGPGWRPDGAAGGAAIKTTTLMPMYSQRRPTKDEVQAAIGLTAQKPFNNTPAKRKEWWGLAHGDGFDGTHVIFDPDLNYPSQNVIDIWFEQRYGLARPVGLAGLVEINVVDDGREYALSVPKKFTRSNEFFYDNAVWRKLSNNKWSKSIDPVAIRMFKEQNGESES